jgi:hypothetical protein
MGILKADMKRRLGHTFHWKADTQRWWLWHQEGLEKEYKTSEANDTKSIDVPRLNAQVETEIYSDYEKMFFNIMKFGIFELDPFYFGLCQCLDSNSCEFFKGIKFGFEFVVVHTTRV